MRKIPFSMLLTALVLCGAFGALLRFPRETACAVQDGLALCAGTLLPALFPFFILSHLIVALGFSRPLGRLFEPLMRRLFHLPGVGATALVLGLLGGYPSGAKTVIELYQQGQCSKQQAERLLAFCNNCGPAFLLGAVGVGIFGDVQYGLLLSGVHLGAALLTGVLFCRHRTGSAYLPDAPVLKQPAASLPAAFTAAVTNSMESLLNLCAFVLCFSAIIQILRLSGIPAALASLLPFVSGENGQTALLGLLEMTCGVTELKDGSIQERLILTSALLGWGGLSVHCQTLSLLQTAGLSPVSYWKGKATHGLLSALLMTLILLQVEGACLLTGASLLILPTRMAKKSSGKREQSIV